MEIASVIDVSMKSFWIFKIEAVVGSVRRYGILSVEIFPLNWSHTGDLIFAIAEV